MIKSSILSYFSMRKAMSSTPKIGFISLGCPKALVDSERIITRLRREGYEIVPTYEEADLVIINTCGFINDAIEESLEAIGEALQQNGKVIVTGCLGARKVTILEKYPHVLAITGPHAYQEVIQLVHQHLPSIRNTTLNVPAHGIKLTPPHYAYLKIAEGCDHNCTFCIIPQLRGRLVSRPINEILDEAELLVKAGVKELLVIAQDLSSYGADVQHQNASWHGRSMQTSLVNLANALGEFGIWIRLHYIYPTPQIDEIVHLMAEGKIVPYLDMPLQHANPRVLKLMQRPANTENMLKRIEKWRKICPDIAIRSSFIVGFPGETEQEFEELLAFLEETQLDRVGCFKYSPVKGAEANNLPNYIPEDVKDKRLNRLMEKQAKISREKLKTKIGKTIPVLIDHIEEKLAIGRSHADAPQIDGNVIINDIKFNKIGNIVDVTIQDSDDYDLFGVLT